MSGADEKGADRREQERIAFHEAAVRAGREGIVRVSPVRFARAMRLLQRAEDSRIRDTGQVDVIWPPDATDGGLDGEPIGPP